MLRSTALSVAVAACCALLLAQAVDRKNRTSPVGYEDTPMLPGQPWRVHDIKRPHPPEVTPGAQPGQPPSDAVVLFDGKDLGRWQTAGKGGAMRTPQWKLRDGYVEVAGGTGDLVSKEKFGSAQIHIEWAAPPVVEGSSQWRGNSGVLIMSRYEIQVLDSWHNPTYADGQAGAVYGQFPPLASPVRPPGAWNTYDIAFEAPRFEAGKLSKPAYVTLFYNGVLVHHHQDITGPMAHRVWRPYQAHAPEEPLRLQDHDTPVRYRNIWVRRLGG